MLILVIEDDWCFRECIDCEDEIPDPYLKDEDDDNQQVLCSTCTAERERHRREKRRVQEHLRPPELSEAICNCGKHLSDCTPWLDNCHEPSPPPKGRKAKRATHPRRDNQRRLF